MADAKISADPVATLVGTEIIPVVQGGANKRTSPNAILALDPELAALAGLTSAANKGIQFTGVGAAGTYDLTTAGKALLDDADAAAQRTTLGLGTIATQAASSVTITGGAISGITDLPVADGGTGASTASGARTNLGLAIGSDVQAYSASTALNTSQALTDGATISWDVALGAFGTVTIAGDRTLANPTNLQAGASYAVKVTQGSGGSHLLTYGNKYFWAGGVAPVLSTAAGAIDIITFISDGTNMYGSCLKAFA